MYVKTCN